MFSPSVGVRGPTGAGARGPVIGIPTSAAATDPEVASALSYDPCKYRRTLDCPEVTGWWPSRCIPHGGQQMSLAIAAGLGLGGNEGCPDLFQPFGGFPDGVRV